MKKILAIIFALVISLAAFAVVACEKPDDQDENDDKPPVYTTIDVETFASNIQAYGDISNYIGVQGYKFDLDLAVGYSVTYMPPIEELSEDEEGEMDSGKGYLDASISGLFDFADLSDVELSLDTSVTEKEIYGEESMGISSIAKLYLYDEGLFLDSAMTYTFEGQEEEEEEPIVDKNCISDITNDFESVVEMLMPLEDNPPYIAEGAGEIIEEDITAAVMSVVDQYIYELTGGTLEEFLESELYDGIVEVLDYLTPNLSITYCESLGHYILEIDNPEEVSFELEVFDMTLPVFNLKAELFAKDNRITNFTVDFNANAEDDFIQLSLSFGESTDKIVKPTSVEDYVEVSAEDEGSILTELKLGYESFMEFVQMISNSRDNTLEFYASSEYEVNFFEDDSTGMLNFTDDYAIEIVTGDENVTRLEIQFMYSVFIFATSESGTTYVFSYTEATEEEAAYFSISELETREFIGFADAVEADLGQQ